MHERNGPVTASPLNATLLRITEQDKWVPTKATVYSREYTSRPDDDQIGHYHLVYRYSVEGEVYTGRFIDFGYQDEASYKKDEILGIRYDPQHPAAPGAVPRSLCGVLANARATKS